MSSERFEVLCRNGLSPGPAPAGLIQSAEAALGAFPKEYVDFLAKYGALVADGIEIYGLFADEEEAPTWQNVVTVNRALRRLGQTGTERPGFVAISDDGMGVYFFIDTAASPGASIWAIGPGVSKRFADGLADLVEKLEGPSGV